MGEKWPRCYGNNFTEISTKEISRVILNAIFWKKITFVLHYQLTSLFTRKPGEKNHCQKTLG